MLYQSSQQSLSFGAFQIIPISYPHPPPDISRLLHTQAQQHLKSKPQICLEKHFEQQANNH